MEFESSSDVFESIALLLEGGGWFMFAWFLGRGPVVDEFVGDVGFAPSSEVAVRWVGVGCEGHRGLDG